MDNSLTLEQFKQDHTLMFDFMEFFFKFKPRKYQESFLNACLTQNRVAGKWCRQSGKTTSVGAYCAFRCSIAPTSIMITAPTQTQSTELYLKVRQFIESTPVISDQLVKSTETELKFKNGSRIKALPTGPEGKSIRGFTADIVIVEEAGIMKDEIINSVITPMLASKGIQGQLIKIGTPLAKNHFYRSCYIDPNYAVINVRWEDCVAEGQYDMKFVEEQKEQLTDIEFRTEYEAEFIEELSMFFPSKLVDTCMIEYPLIRII